ncbi:MAG: tetratricopeptide repeat protein [Candidatus Gastranaerophilales bacterium]|nr:tetratricopeptide repeat protein [Candidatus Gastranaerophilales bacterium]
MSVLKYIIESYELFIYGFFIFIFLVLAFLYFYFSRVETCYKKGLLLLEAKDYKGAIRKFKRFLHKYPKSQEGLHKLGLAFFHNKEFEKAALCFDKITEINADFFAAIYNLALSFQMTDDIDEATKLYKKAISINPNDVDTYYNLGIMNFKAKKYEIALSYFQKANEIGPGKPLILYYIARCCDLLNISNNLKVQEHVTKLYLQLIGEEGLPKDYLITAAYSSAKTGQLQKTLLILDKALESNPENANVYKLAAITDLISLNKDGAKSNILIAIDLDPNDDEAYNILQYAEKLINKDNISKESDV